MSLFSKLEALLGVSPGIPQNLIREAITEAASHIEEVREAFADLRGDVRDELAAMRREIVSLTAPSPAVVGDMAGGSVSSSSPSVALQAAVAGAAGAGTAEPAAGISSGAAPAAPPQAPDPAPAGTDATADSPAAPAQSETAA